MPEKISAGGLFGSLKKTFGFGPQHPTEAPAAATEMPAAPPPAPALEPAVAVPTSELPDWLSAAPVTGPVPAPLPAPPVPAAVVETPAVGVETLAAVEAAVEAPVFPPEAKAESDPFATTREFNGYMETIRQAQAVLASGTPLVPEEQRKALIAVARSNSLLLRLPLDVLKSVFLMRAVAANNPDFGRNDFQLEMLAAMDVIKTGIAVRG